MEEEKKRKMSKTALLRQGLVVILDTREKKETKDLFEAQFGRHPEKCLRLEIKSIPAGDIAIAFEKDDELHYVMILEKKTFNDLHQTIRGVKRDHESQVVRGSYRNQADALVKVGAYCTGYLMVGPMEVGYHQAQGKVADATMGVCSALARINLAYGDIHKIFLAPSHDVVPQLIFKVCDVLREEGVIEQLMNNDLDASRSVDSPIVTVTGDPEKDERVSSISDRDFLRFENTLRTVLRNRAAVEEKEVIRKGAILKADDPDKSYKILLTSIKGVTVENFADGIKPAYPTMLDLYSALEREGPAALKVVDTWKLKRRDTVFRLLTGKDPKDFPVDRDDKKTRQGAPKNKKQKIRTWDDAEILEDPLSPM